MRGNRPLFWLATGLTAIVIVVGTLWKGPVALLFLVPYLAIVFWPALAAGKRDPNDPRNPISPWREAVHPVDDGTRDPSGTERSPSSPADRADRGADLRKAGR
jgi:hypothetical protein